MRQLWGHLGHVRSGGVSQNKGAAGAEGTGSSAGPVWVLSVTQHRTTPHESLHCFLVHPEFFSSRSLLAALTQLGHLPAMQALPHVPASPPLLALSPLGTCLCAAGARLLLRDPNPQHFLGSGVRPSEYKHTMSTSHPLTPGQNGAKVGLCASWAMRWDGVL